MTTETRRRPASVPPRVVEDINGALHRLLGADPHLYFLGEDVLDPYGGAFKVAKGLSTAYPDQVLTTPLSENGLVGVANGLALCGNRVIAEIMFGDFLALAFDQVLNFSAKSVTMYGRTVPMRLVIRCPVGGRRGYGPTHSQSLQKHLIGIPNLALFEMSPFHEAEAVLGTALDRGVPGVVFEDKVLYGRRVYRDGQVNELSRFEMVGEGLGWALVTPHDDVRPAGPDLLIISPGGLADQAIGAAERLGAENGIVVHTLVPAQLYPLDIEPVLPLLQTAGRVCVVEEGTAGGTWGAEIARVLYERAWAKLRQPVILINSADSVIPTAPHLERAVLVDGDLIHARIAAEFTGDGRARATPSEAGTPAPAAATGEPIVTPKLNNNDDRYLVTEWLYDDGQWVEAGTPLVAVETSKAVEELDSTAAGYLRRAVEVGQECGVGEPLGYLLPTQENPGDGASAAGTAPAPEPVPEPVSGARHRLGRAQQGTAAVVTKSHREVPSAFTVVRVAADAVLTHLSELSDRADATVGLVDAVVKLVAGAHERFPLFFGSLGDDHTVTLADAPRVGVTLDAGNGLFVPVVHGAHELPLPDVADELMRLRLKAVRSDFAAHELSGANISVSLNNDAGVVFTYPIVMWPQLCMVSLGGLQQELHLDEAERPVERRFVHLGLAYDHRVINGRDAVLFLTDLSNTLEDPARLASTLAE